MEEAELGLEEGEDLEEEREIVDRREASRAAVGDAILVAELGVIGGEVKKTAEVEGEDVSTSEPTALTLGM